MTKEASGWQPGEAAAIDSASAAVHADCNAGVAFIFCREAARVCGSQASSTHVAWSLRLKCSSKTGI